MGGYFQGFGRAFVKSFLLPLFMVVVSLGTMTSMGLMNADTSFLEIDPEASGEGFAAQAKLYLLRIPGMKHVLIDQEAMVVDHVVVRKDGTVVRSEEVARLSREAAAMGDRLQTSARPRLRPTATQ
jgi:hypothetical protein